MSSRNPIRALRAALFAFTALVAGCAVGPDFMRPAAPKTEAYTPAPLAEMPAAGGATRQRVSYGKEVTTDWWKNFGSPELDDVVALAIENSPTLESSRETLAAAREQITVATAPLFPQADLTADAGRARARGTSTRPGATYANSFSAGPLVSYNLDIWGATRRSIEQSSALAEFQRYQLGVAYLTLTGSAVTQAITIALQRAQIDLVNELIGLDRENLDLTRASYEGGRSARTDVLAAESQLTADQTLLPPLNQSLAVARHALSVLAGHAPADWTPPDFDLNKLSVPEDLPVHLPSELVRQRPDILAAEATLHASSAAIGIATANLYPNLQLTASWSRTGPNPAALFDSTSTVWSIAAGLTQPLFHGGELLATRRAAVSTFRADLADYRDTVVVAFGQVADVLRALEHDAQFLEAERTAMDAAQASADLIQESYRVGQASLLQVLDARRLWFQAQLGFVRATSQRLLDTVQLYQAMGGAWTGYAPAQAQAD